MLEEAKEHFTVFLKTNELVPLPTYTGRRTSKIKIEEEVSPEIHLVWIVTAVMLDFESSISIL